MTDHQNRNGPPPEVGPRPGCHPRTEGTDINLTSNLNLADTQQCNGHRAVQCLECGRYLTAKDSVRLHLGPICRRRVAA